MPKEGPAGPPGRRGPMGPPGAPGGTLTTQEMEEYIKDFLRGKTAVFCGSISRSVLPSVDLCLDLDASESDLFWLTWLLYILHYSTHHI